MAVEARILVVEDERSIGLAITDRLESEGYSVELAHDGDSGYRRAIASPPQLILLDVMLPGRDGFTVCRDLRARGVTMPILMLTAKDQIVDKVLGLKIGADDYLTKPFEMVELLVRVEVLLRRTQPNRTSADSYPIGEYVLDLRRQELRRGNEHTQLSTQEFKLLRYLYEHRGEVLDRDELLDAVWGYDTVPYTRTVDVHVAWLRQKLNDSRTQQLIVTVRGRGYKLSG